MLIPSTINIVDVFDQNKFNLNLSEMSLEKKVSALLVRDLFRLQWRISSNANGQIVILPPDSYEKEAIKNSMAFRRTELLNENINWINKHSNIAEENLAFGKDVLNSSIDPIIEICETQKQFDIFRYFRYYWSSPYSEYVGRRIKIIVRDNCLPNKPVIGIAALGSSIIHIPERDEWIGWDKETRTKNIIYAMDLYVLGALPPYNYLLGGKLLSYILASNEIRKVYKGKYKNAVTQIKGRKASELVCLFTTSLYGKSSQYNRIKLDNHLLYQPVGETKGFGSLHLTNETFQAMIEFLKMKNIIVPNKFGDGPSWRMRVIRAATEQLGIDSDIILNHSFKRSIYTIPLTTNYKEYLLGKDKKPQYFNYPMKDLVTYWKQRWLDMRLKNDSVIDKVNNFIPSSFSIFSGEV